MKIIDSSIWIALFHERDSQNKKAKKVFSKITFPVAVTEYIILETCTVLAAKASKEIANNFLTVVADNEDIRILLSNEKFFLRVIERFKNAPNKKLSFTDTSLLCLSRGYEVVTFDKRLEDEINF